MLLLSESFRLKFQRGLSAAARLRMAALLGSTLCRFSNQRRSSHQCWSTHPAYRIWCSELFVLLKRDALAPFISVCRRIWRSNYLFLIQKKGANIGLRIKQ